MPYCVNYAEQNSGVRPYLSPLHTDFGAGKKMFGKKLQRADYSGGVNVLTLCCGFFSKSSSKRKDSDEIPKPHINGEAGLGTENEGEVAYDQISEKKHSEKVRKKKIKTKVDENGKDILLFFSFLFFPPLFSLGFFTSVFFFFFFFLLS